MNYQWQCIQIMLKKNRKGFSFIEVIVAIAIFFIFLAVFFEIKGCFIKTKIKIHEEISYLNLEVCIQKTFLKKYTFEELQAFHKETMYYDIEKFDIESIANLNLNDYTFEKPEKSYMEISIDKGIQIEIKSKVYKDGVMKKEFSFVKGHVDEERNVIN